MMFKYLVLFLLSDLCHTLSTQPRRRCKYGDDCWPDAETWQNFNNSISGRLIRTFPSAAVCHGQNSHPEDCTIAKEQWDNSFWRTNQTGAYTAIVWELGNQQCFINSSMTAPCQPGLGKFFRSSTKAANADERSVPHYSVVATSVADIQAAVRLASDKDLYLVVKNTGHDQ
jgi:hypothetical protein